jgi:chemotaxis protein CheX
MLDTELTTGKAEAKPHSCPQHDVSGIIVLTGNATGAVVLSFPRLAAFKIVSRMLGTQVKIVGAELVDGIGELANIVAGNAKQYLDGYDLKISLPDVILGKDTVATPQLLVPTLVVPFNSALGPVSLEVTLKTG